MLGGDGLCPWCMQTMLLNIVMLFALFLIIVNNFVVHYMRIGPVCLESTQVLIYENWCTVLEQKYWSLTMYHTQNNLFLGRSNNFLSRDYSEKHVCPDCTSQTPVKKVQTCDAFFLKPQNQKTCEVSIVFPLTERNFFYPYSATPISWYLTWWQPDEPKYLTVLFRVFMLQPHFN